MTGRRLKSGLRQGQKQMARNKLVFATHNRNKLREVRQLLDLPKNTKLLSLDDLPDMPKVEENGSTFIENAFMKAREVSSWSGLPTLADDSGLEVDALNGEPSVYSASYGGLGIDAIDLLLHNLEGVPLGKRTAHFRCVVAFVDPYNPGKVKLREGVCDGIITETPRGSNGFGFDPVFYMDELGCTFAEASAEEKHKVSHRGKAIRLMAQFLQLHFE
jgi:XTP/dITP diphosphohydrolase